MRSVFSTGLSSVGLISLTLATAAMVGCSEYNVAPDEDGPQLVDRDGDGEPDDLADDAGPNPLRDTDGDGTPDSQDDDVDDDGIPNDLDGDPDGDGAPGWTLPDDPEDDPPVDETGLPERQEGDARGRVCAPNGTTWVSGATVTVPTSEGTWETLTNGDGWWQLPGLPPGDHQVFVEKGSFAMTFSIHVEDGELTEAVFDECLEQGDLRIAVVAGEWDSIGSVLDHLAIEFDGVNGFNDNATTDFLTDSSALATYDMIFFNCGMSLDWADSDRATVAANLQDFVNNGGSIYASDWAYFTVEAAFPDQNTFVGNDDELGGAFRGASGLVTAHVDDPAMASLLGGVNADIDYDLGGWVPLVSSQATPLLSGSFTYYDDWDLPQNHTGPLATRFTSGQGSVTYTSFHNEVQTTFDMDLLLQDIVLSL